MNVEINRPWVGRNRRTTSEGQAESFAATLAIASSSPTPFFFPFSSETSVLWRVQRNERRQIGHPLPSLSPCQSVARLFFGRAKYLFVERHVPTTSQTFSKYSGNPTSCPSAVSTARTRTAKNFERWTNFKQRPSRRLECLHLEAVRIQSSYAYRQFPLYQLDIRPKHQ